MSRSRRSQAGHDKVVLREANKLERRGFDVTADISGFPDPKTLGGYQPDIIATKGSKRVIVEIETPASQDSARDLAQKRAFRQAADRSQNTGFRRIITKK